MNQKRCDSVFITFREQNNRMKTILITGASGLIGSALTERLLAENYRVRHLGRSKKGHPGVTEFLWDPEKGAIDEAALKDADVIVHLAGANVGKGRWTEAQKRTIIDSRVKSTQLLYDTLKKINQAPQKIICASAMGYYGIQSADHAFRENDPPGTDFMAQVCIAWEKAAQAFSEICPVLTFRIGVVLSDKGGALPLMAKPVRMFAGAPVGSGKQVVSWIHITDMCRLFLEGIHEENFSGVYNAVAPHPVTNKEMTKAIGQQLRRPVWGLNVPSFLMRAMLGEQADIVLEGVEISAGKILQEGFTFEYPAIREALKNLLAA
jgi:uncharacterized protein (TIGR01777 family)